MAEEITLEEYKKAYREVVAEDSRMIFVVHLVVYILVNVMLIIVNFRFTFGFFWFLYPLIGWGIGILVHYLLGIRWIEKLLEGTEARAEHRAKKK